jgi:PadR family transcriptional regulator
MPTKGLTKLDAMARRLERDFLGGSIRLHILYHADRADVFGAGLMEELQRHGYRLSPGTLYPILHALQRGGYLRSKARIIDGRRRRTYVASALGRAALDASRARILELVNELFEEHENRNRGGRVPSTRNRRAAKC